MADKKAAKKAKKGAAKKAPKKKPTTRRQQDLLEEGGPGVAPPISIPEVDEAAADYVRKRDRRQDLTRLEVEAKQRLIDVLHTHEKEIGRDGEHVLRYKHEDLLCELMPEGEKLRVRKGNSDEQE
jgi:hypothetical protein